MAERRFFSPASMRLEGVFDAVFFLGLSSAWLGLLGRLHWMLDLLSHFRWQYLFGCLLLILWALFRKRWVLFGVALATLFLNAWLIGRLGFGTERWTPFAGKSLRVVSLNVLTSNPTKGRVLDYLRQVNPDMIFLMEVDADWGRALHVLKSEYPHGLVLDRQDNFGLALLSRVPLLQVQIFTTRESDMPSIEARLTHRERVLTFVGTHPLPPLNQWMAQYRDEQLRGIGEYVRQSQSPVLVVGDLNATPWSYGWRAIVTGNSLAYRCPDPAWRPTWNPNTPFAVPIDHALCTPPLIITSRKIGPNVGSDHRPQELEITWE